MKKTTLCLLLAVMFGTMGPGCIGTAISEGAGVLLGPKGVYAEIQPVGATKDARPLGEYTRFELGEISDQMGGKVPRDLWTYLPGEFRRELNGNKLPDERGGKTLLVRGAVLHYEDASLLGFVAGPLEEVVTRIELVDKGSNKVLGTANCIGRTTERVNAGVKEKAQGLAKAIVSWIDARYPKERR